MKYTIDHPRVIAEGDAFGLKATGCVIEKIDDRCGVLSGASIPSGSRVNAVVRNGILKPYMPFGRLGQMNFSRRTFFVLCNDRGARFWAPVDLTLMPRYEGAVKGEVVPVETGGALSVLLRNNASRPLKGNAYVRAARSTLPFAVDVPARSEREYRVTIPSNALAMLSPGDNRASVILPGNNELELTFIASKLFDSNAKLAAYASSRISPITLPESFLLPDERWRETREFYAYMHYPWAGCKAPMEALAGKSEVTVPGLPCVNFAIQDRKMAVVSLKSGAPNMLVNLGSRECKKIYLLVIPFLDNHDMFAPVARVDIALANGGMISRTLRFPGDLDWWCPQQIVGDFATARSPRDDRFGLLPTPNSSFGDWPQAKPPAFPQPDYWATSLPLKAPSGVMNVIEIDLGRLFKVKSVTICTLGVDPALGVVGMSVEKEGGQQALEGTPWMPPLEFRAPRTVFEFNDPGDLQGWKTEGDAFAVATVLTLFNVPTLNSLAKAGETATGKAISPDFVIGPADSFLEFTHQGGTSALEDGPGLLCIDLIDSTTGARLDRVLASGSHVLRGGGMPVDKWRGKTVHMELIDRNTGGGWAWLGLQRVGLTSGG